MKKLQREVALAHLELMHLAAEGLSTLTLTNNGQRRLRARVLSNDLAQGAGRGGLVPIFTSQAAREAWEAESEQRSGDGYGRS